MLSKQRVSQPVTKTIQREDIALLTDIADIYIALLNGHKGSRDEVLKKVISMVRLSREIIVEYDLEDLRNKREIGTTRMKWLSSGEFETLENIYSLEILLSNTSQESYEQERTTIFKTILTEAQQLLDIRILSESSKVSLSKVLEKAA